MRSLLSVSVDVHDQLVLVTCISHDSESVRRTLIKLVSHLGRHFKRVYSCQLSSSHFHPLINSSAQEHVIITIHASKEIDIIITVSYYDNYKMRSLRLKIGCNERGVKYTLHPTYTPLGVDVTLLQWLCMHYNYTELVNIILLFITIYFKLQTVTSQLCVLRNRNREQWTAEWVDSRNNTVTNFQPSLWTHRQTSLSLAGLCSAVTVVSCSIVPLFHRHLLRLTYTAGYTHIPSTWPRELRSRTPT